MKKLSARKKTTLRVNAETIRHLRTIGAKALKGVNGGDDGSSAPREFCRTGSPPPDETVDALDPRVSSACWP